MPRKPRFLQLSDETAYHVLSRGHNREAIFAHEDDKNTFLALLRRYRQRDGFRLYHYCLMDNHFHLLLQPRDPRQLSRLMAGILVAYAGYFTRRHRFVGHLFQGRFKSPLVQRDGYWLSCGRYIERNPVVAGLARTPWDYRWSSCRAYALGEADDLLDENPCYQAWSDPLDRRRRLWQEFVVGEDAREAEIARGDWALGDAAFRTRLAQVLGRPLPRPRGPPPKGPTTTDASMSREDFIRK
jgi:putative transposase